VLSWWAIRIGCVLLPLGALLLTSIADLLPIDLWVSMRKVLQPIEKQTYVRVVAAERSYIVEAVLVSLGLALVLLGDRFRRST